MDTADFATGLDRVTAVDPGKIVDHGVSTRLLDNERRRLRGSEPGNGEAFRQDPHVIARECGAVEPELRFIDETGAPNLLPLRGDVGWADIAVARFEQAVANLADQ